MDTIKAQKPVFLLAQEHSGNEVAGTYLKFPLSCVGGNSLSPENGVTRAFTSEYDPDIVVVFYLAIAMNHRVSLSIFKPLCFSDFLEGKFSWCQCYSILLATPLPAQNNRSIPIIL